MSEYSFTRSAELDLEDIFDQIAEHNENAARKVMNNLQQRCIALADMPNSGRQRPELHPDIRSVAEGSYTIYYKQRGNGILVVRVFHCAREIDRYFSPAGLPGEMRDE